MSVIDLGAITSRDRYKLLTAVVIPRPVAWVTTISADGVVNAAPYSFFNVFGQDPALVILGIENKADGIRKDTAANIVEGGEFVVNIATPALVDRMVATAAAYGRDRGEPEALGLAVAPSEHVRPPRLVDAPVALECRHRLTLNFTANRDIIIGEAVALAAHDGIVDLERMHVEWGDEWPVARLFADRYARLEEMARHAIPEPEPEA